MACRGSATAFRKQGHSVNQPVAFAWGDLLAAAKRAGRGLSSVDGLIAATATAYDLTLATRNIKNFDGLNIKLVHPWAA